MSDERHMMFNDVPTLRGFLKAQGRKRAMGKPWHRTQWDAQMIQIALSWFRMAYGNDQAVRAQRLIIHHALLITRVEVVNKLASAVISSGIMGTVTDLIGTVKTHPLAGAAVAEDAPTGEEKLS